MSDAPALPPECMAPPPPLPSPPSLNASGSPPPLAGSLPVPRDPREDPFFAGGAPRRTLRQDPLDPSERHAAQIGPFGASPADASPPAGAPAPATAADAQVRTSLETILPELVRKVAWSGDGRRGTMRLELGAGSLAGGTLVVHADDGRVRVELDAPSGTDVGAWKARLEERLAQRGVDVDEVDVH